ncbi:MAG: right-handed parallel beta-helix repeat-containing protein, partial [Oscillospiraceae bacterium]
VKVWWVSGGDNRFVSLYNASGAKVDATKTSVKNALYIDTLKVSDAGTYQLVCAEGTNYIFKVQVTEGGSGTVARGDWASVKAPAITALFVDGGTMTAKVKADVGADGGDAVVVKMLDSKGNELDSKQSIAEKADHSFDFKPAASGDYTFTVSLQREGETAKTGPNVTKSFVLPLKAPTIVSATSKGDGKVELIWQPVDEATGYKVYVDGKEVGTSAATKYMASGLTVGKKYSFTVAATRAGEVGPASAAVSTTATKDSKQTWGFIRYGTSTDDVNNGYTGSINDDNKVVVYSENGKGKINQGSNDGLAFYYTAIPTTKNFTLRAKIHVDSWTFSNGQDGFGMLVMDSVPEVASTSPFWTNQYMLAVSKMEYKWDSQYKEVSANGDIKYTQNIGIGVNQKIGVTADNVVAVTAGTDPELVKAICGTQYPLDLSLATAGKAAGTYNRVGNEKTGKAPTAYDVATDFDVEIQKNNTGYFLTYYKNGKVVKTQKFYDPNALNVLDKDNVYVGFFAARNARVTVSNVQLTTIDPKDDKPAEAKPKEKVRANVVIKSGAVANNENYTLTISANVKGTAEVSVNGTVAKTFDVKTANEQTSAVVKLADGTNKISVKFTPDAKQNLGADKELADTKAVTAEIDVAFNNYFSAQKNLYVSPNGTKYGNGGPKNPLDVYTAVSVAQPGQTIVVMEGTYKLTSSINVARGADGTKDKMIYMVADPEAKTKPVFDFQGKGSTAGLVAAGDYWYFKGFDVCNAANGVSGLLLAGSNCVVDSVDAYNNGGTGIYIRSLNNTTDPKSEWPCNNLVLNCTAYNNADKGYEDADGFAAKFTIGAGNVFDGCVSHHNADDGWDLFARVSSGRIEPVTIQNCVAYKNGYLVDGTKAGNGNGFKLGGENLPGGHILKNCVSFENKLNGITSNSCPDVKVINCTSYKNEAANLTLYTGIASASTDFEVTGLVSYKGGASDDVKAQGTQSKAKYENATNHFNGNGVTDAWFKSLTFKGSVARKANGTIDMQGYLELTDKAAKDAGARMTGTESGNVTITPDEKLPNPPTGNAALPITAAALAIAGAAVFVISRKRKQ